MANRGPSLTALLGLLAVAGYQNRDKLSDLARKMQSPDAKPQVGSGLADQVKGFLDSSPIGGALTTALSELVDMFQGKPQEKTATSWVSSGQNEELSSSDLAEVIGEDTLGDLTQKKRDCHATICCMHWRKSCRQRLTQ